MRLLLVLGLAVPALWATPAVAFCNRPLPPPCAAGQAAFADRTAVTACHRDVQAYVGAAMTYLQCLTDEHGAAGKEMNQVVHLFNCRLAGRTPCPGEPAAPLAPAGPAAAPPAPTAPRR